MGNNDTDVHTDIDEILDMILSTFGMNLPETHRKDVEFFIKERIDKRKETIREYVDSLSKDRNEYVRFIDAVTINESYFFRDSRHFSLLYNEILTELFEERDHIIIWSAAAAAGEEALSLAAMCESLLQQFPGKKYTIYASDINVSALNRFQDGRYTKSAFREDGSEFHTLLSSYMKEITDGYLMDESIRKHIVINEHNLFSTDYVKFQEDFDLVLLRNVFIYMPMENRNTILQNVVSHMKHDGFLFLSASEVPLVWHPTLQVKERNGIYFFRRNTDSEAALDIQKEASTGISEIKVEKKQRPKRPDIIQKEKMYEYINHWLFNPLFEKQNTTEHELAELFVVLIKRINEGDIAGSEKLLTNLQKTLKENEVICFYFGVVEKLQENIPKSVENFQRALDIHQAFWPARYELAMLEKEKKPGKARKLFTRCIQDIKVYINRNKYTFHFLLDGFNALYFLKICEFWEKRLGTKSRTAGG